MRGKGLFYKSILPAVFICSISFSYPVGSTDQVIHRRIRAAGLESIEETDPQLYDALQALKLTPYELYYGKFRKKVEELLDIKDLVKDQRLAQFGEEYAEKAEELAKSALRQMAIKLAQKGRSFEELVKSDDFLQKFNELFGVRPIVVAGGFAQRYSPTGLINKTVAPGTQEEANMRLAFNGILKSQGIKPVIIIDEMVLQAVLKDKYLRDPQSYKRVIEGDLQNGKTGNLNGVIIDKNLIEKLFDPEKFRRYFPTDSIILFGHFEGHGGAFMDAVELLDANGIRTEAKYFLSLFGELATIQDETKANTGLITYLKQVAGDYLITAGGKKSLVTEKKGNFIFDEQGRLTALTDWKYIEKIHGKDVLNELAEIQALLQKYHEGTLTTQERQSLEDYKRRYRTITDDYYILINATANIFNNDVISYFGQLRESIYKENKDPDTHITTYLMWDLIHIIAQDFKNNNRNYPNQDNWPIGFIDIAKGPDSIKDVARHNKFSKPVWNKALVEFVQSLAGVNADNLEELTVSLDDTAEIDIKEQLRNLLQGKDITLEGKVHIDLETEIGEKVELKDTYVSKDVKIANGVELNGVVLEKTEVGEEVKITGQADARFGNLTYKIIIKGEDKDNLLKIGDNAVIEGLGYVAQDVEPNQNITLNVDVYGSYPEQDIIFSFTDLSPPVYDELTEIASLLSHQTETSYKIGDTAIKDLDAQDLKSLFQNNGEEVELKLLSSLPKDVKGAPYYDDSLELKLIAKIVNAQTLSRIFGKFLDNPRKPKEGILKRIDQIYLKGKLLLSEDSRVGNATHLEDSLILPGVYLGDGWGMLSSSALRAVFSDNVLVRNRGKEGHTTSYQPPREGRMNTASIIINSLFENAYIGAGSGQEVPLEDGRKGYINQVIKNTIIPEGAEITSDVNGIRENEQRLADALKELNVQGAAQKIIDGINRGFYQDRSVKVEEGRITMSATALLLIAKDNPGLVDSILKEIGKQNEDYQQRIIQRIEILKPFVISSLAHFAVLPEFRNKPDKINIDNLMNSTGIKNETFLLQAINHLSQEGEIDEYLQLVQTDEDGLPVLDQDGMPKLSRVLKKRNLVHNISQGGDWHVTVHVAVVDRWGQVLIQKDAEKQKYDITAAGHLALGVNFKEGALRELLEELGGVDAGQIVTQRIKKVGVYFKEASDQISQDRVEDFELGKLFKYHDTSKKNKEVTIFYTYVVDSIKSADKRLNLHFERQKVRDQIVQPGVEADEITFLNIEDLKQDFQSQPDNYRSGIKQYFTDGIYQDFKDRLDDQILSTIELHKYEVPEDAELELVVVEEMNERIKADRKTGMTEYVEANGQVHQDKDMNEIRQELPEYTSLIPPGAKAVIPNGNLLWNDWFVAWMNGKLYHRRGEPVNERTYSMLVVWKDGRVSIEDIRFRNNKVIRITPSGEEEITDKVKFATFGEKILANNDFVPLTDVYGQFEDLRHLFTFPRIKWDDIKKLGFKVSGNLSGSFYFGANYLLGRQELRLAAQNNPIDVDIYDVFKEILIAHDQNNASLLAEDEVKTQLRKLLEAALKKSDYRYKDNGPLYRGEYRFEGDNLVINLREGIYPHTLMGIRGNGEIVLYAVNGLSGRLGATYAQLQKLLQQDGVKEAILIANGGDVLLWADGEVKVSSPEGRNRFTSLLVVK